MWLNRCVRLFVAARVRGDKQQSVPERERERTGEGEKEKKKELGGREGIEERGVVGSRGLRGQIFRCAAEKI